jgi:serpin B
MPLAFDPTKADLTGIHAPSELSISTATHQADIDVDEKGTEASAATAFGGLGGIGQPYPLRHITFRLDRPFIFLVRDVATGAILFLGQVTDPSVGKGG